MSNTALVPNPDTGNYEFLLESWNLLDCFEYYFQQNELWTTKSIEAELNPDSYLNDEKKMPAKVQSPPNPTHVEKQSVCNMDAKDAMKVIHMSFGISLTYNVVGLSFAVQGTMSPLFAAILMPLSTVTIIGFTSISTHLYASKNGLSGSERRNR